MKLKLFVAAVALVAAAAAISAALLVHDGTHGVGSYLALIAGLVLLAEYLQVRHYHGKDQIGALNLMEGILAPLVLFGSGLEVVAVCIASLLVADRLRSNDWLKVLFNVAQWTLAASLASLLIHVMREDKQVPTMLALVVAVVTMSVVNQAAITSVLSIASGGARRGDREERRAKLVGFLGRLASNVAGLATGLTLTALYLWNPWLLLLGALFVLGLDGAGRANASLRADHARLEGMHSATHALAASIDVATGLQAFLTEARAGFEVQEAELVLFSERGATVHRCTAAGGAGYAVCIERHPLGEAVASRLPEATRFAAGDGTTAGAILARSGHTPVLAPPVRSGGTTIGGVFFFHRHGMGGFGAGGLKNGGPRPPGG